MPAPKPPEFRRRAVELARRPASQRGRVGLETPCQAGNWRTRWSHTAVRARPL
jgi:hypothetical protein